MLAQCSLTVALLQAAQLMTLIQSELYVLPIYVSQGVKKWLGLQCARPGMATGPWKSGSCLPGSRLDTAELCS